MLWLMYMQVVLPSTWRFAEPSNSPIAEPTLTPTSQPTGNLNHPCMRLPVVEMINHDRERFQTIELLICRP